MLLGCLIFNNCVRECFMSAKNKDAKKLMDAFSLYEEEQVLPRANVLRYTAKVLETLGEPVTFNVPPPVCLTPVTIAVELSYYLAAYVLISQQQQLIPF